MRGNQGVRGRKEFYDANETHFHSGSLPTSCSSDAIKDAAYKKETCLGQASAHKRISGILPEGSKPSRCGQDARVSGFGEAFSRDDLETRLPEEFDVRIAPIVPKILPGIDFAPRKWSTGSLLQSPPIPATWSEETWKKCGTQDTVFPNAGRKLSFLRPLPAFTFTNVRDYAMFTS